jgi:cyclohexyl-isocyanide hydratase
MTEFSIGIPIVEQFDLMDVANPYEIFCWARPFWKNADVELNVMLIGHDAGVPVPSFNGASLTTHASFSSLATQQLDVLFVPGGGDSYLNVALKDSDLLTFVSDQAEKAACVASVCTGAFVLAQANLLNGVQATTHWNFLTRFQSTYPDVQVVNGYPRYVRDGKFVTGGGISSGIDTALSLMGQIAGQQVGKDIELAIQYRPQPPYGVGDPSVADYATWHEVVTDLS